MKTDLSLKRTFAWITFFAISMGFLETAVVIYLRELYYPSGFSFPLQPIPPNIALVEFVREAATIIMLIAVGVMAGRNAETRFAWFIYAFAIWDIFYYVFLKIFIGWPESLLTWDILFLIPFPWVGPVIAPCLIALSMVVLAGIIIVTDRGPHPFRSSGVGARLMTIGAFLALYSFMEDYVLYLRRHNETAWSLLSDKKMFEEISGYIPKEFNWAVFISGMVLISLGLWKMWKKNR